MLMYYLSKFTSPLVHGMQLLIWQMPFSPSLSKSTLRSSLFSAGKASNTLSLAYLGYINYAALCHNLAHRDLGSPVGKLVCWKRKANVQSFTPAQPCKNGPWTWNTFLPRDKKPTQSVLSLSSCVGTSFSVSCSTCTPSFCLSMCSGALRHAPNYFRCHGGLGGELLLWHQRGACRPIAVHWIPGETPWLWGANTPYWSWSSHILWLETSDVGAC